jgi:hypothetical protein
MKEPRRRNPEEETQKKKPRRRNPEIRKSRPGNSVQLDPNLPRGVATLLYSQYKPATKNNMRMPYVDYKVASGHERRGITGKEDRQVVELINVTQALHRGARNPELFLSIQSRDTVQRGVHVTGTDRINSNTIWGPLSGEGLGQHDHTGLRSVITALLLRPVNDASTHGRNQDHRAASSGLDHGVGHRLGTDEAARQVYINETPEHLNVITFGRNVGADVKK